MAMPKPYAKSRYFLSNSYASAAWRRHEKMFLEHVDQPVLEGHDPVPLGLVDLLAGLLFYRSQMQAVTPKRVIIRML